MLERLIEQSSRVFGAEVAKATVNECMREAGLERIEDEKDLIKLTQWLLRRRTVVEPVDVIDKPHVMSEREHLEIGVAALKRGFIDARVLGQAMMAVGEVKRATAEEVWLEPNRLNEIQLR